MLTIEKTDDFESMVYTNDQYERRRIGKLSYRPGESRIFTIYSNKFPENLSVQDLHQLVVELNLKL